MLTARVPDFNDRAVQICHVAKALYRLCKENENGIATTEEVCNWLEKWKYPIGNKENIRDMLVILFENGMAIVKTHRDKPEYEAWEWSLEEGKLGQPIITKKIPEPHTPTHQS